MANNSVPMERIYRFDDLNKMHQAILSAFGSMESGNHYFRKNLTLYFTPYGSRVIDTMIIHTMESYGGRLVTEEDLEKEEAQELGQKKSSNWIGEFLYNNIIKNTFSQPS